MKVVFLVWLGLCVWLLLAWLGSHTYRQIPPVLESWTDYTQPIPCEFLTGSQIRQFVQSPAYLTYQRTISPSVLAQKTGGMAYHHHLRPLQTSEQQWVRRCLHQLPSHPLTHSGLSWKFIGTSRTLESGMPFTLGDVILLPPGLTVPDETESRRVTHTLAHEWMHVLQRKYPKIHRRFIRQQMNFHPVQLVSGWNLPGYEIYSNPDGLQTPAESWAFTTGKRWYIPLLLTPPGPVRLAKKSLLVSPVSNHSPTVAPRAVTSSGTLRNNVNTTLQHRFHSCPQHNLYHPHEILAELGADYLVQGTSGSSVFDGFYRKLARQVAKTPTSATLLPEARTDYSLGQTPVLIG